MLEEIHMERRVIISIHMQVIGRSPLQENVQDGIHSRMVKGEYLTDRLTDEAIQFVKQNKEGPFFLHLSHYAVHSPLQSKEKLIEKYKKIPKSKRQGNPAAQEW